MMDMAIITPDKKNYTFRNDSIEFVAVTFHKVMTHRNGEYFEQNPVMWRTWTFFKRLTPDLIWSWYVSQERKDIT